MKTLCSLKYSLILGITLALHLFSSAATAQCIAGFTNPGSLKKNKAGFFVVDSDGVVNVSVDHAMEQAINYARFPARFPNSFRSATIQQPGNPYVVHFHAVGRFGMGDPIYCNSVTVGENELTWKYIEGCSDDTQNINSMHGSMKFVKVGEQQTQIIYHSETNANIPAWIKGMAVSFASGQTKAATQAMYNGLCEK
jgi:hypothetical protein